ncbi:MAG: hypothetical protein ACOCV2_14580, partial [Persicimonas sp.]
MPSCDDRPTLHSDDPENWAVETDLAKFAPRSARAVTVARDLETLDEYLAFARRGLPVAELDDAMRLLEALGGSARFDDKSVEDLGLARRAPAVLFYDRGYWSLALGVDEPTRFAEAVAEATDEERFRSEAAEFGSFDASLVRLEDDSDAPVYLAHGDHMALISLPIDAARDPSTPRLPESWLPDSQRARFVEIDERRDLFERTSGGEFVGVVRPSTWLAEIDSTGQAEVLRQQLMTQIGPVGFELNSASLDESAQLDIVLPGDPGAPEMVSDLGSADGELPPMGGLIEPGVLGAARLSVDPEQFYGLAISAMPAERRNDVNAFLERLAADFEVDLQRDVLDNVRGHAMVVAYGLEREVFESDDAHWFLKLAKLQATREAVLMPIRAREPIEKVLDAWTTLSKGKLSRQRAGQTLQYAWLDGGELEWAFILSDEYVIYVDSAAAFEHAVAYEERARPLGDEFEAQGLTRLVGGDHRERVGRVDRADGRR